MLTHNQIIRFILAFKVKHLRLEKKLSYQELSNQTGLSTSYLSDIEKGKRYPKPDKIDSLANALDVDYDYLVSTSAPKKLKPIIDLINSNFLKIFPLEKFGVSMEKALELFAQTPAQVNAFISTFFKIARNYQIDDQEFYLEALRSYQDMHNNHFPALETAVGDFKKEFSIKESISYSSEFLEEQLEELYDIRVDREVISENKKLQSLRSFYSPKKKILYLRGGLSTAQENFLMGRELGFQFLQFKERPYETTILNIDSFEILYNNYKASHFSAALLMDTKNLVSDINEIARENVWSPRLIINLLQKYNVTPEMLFQRFTNILPHYFGLEDLFFIKLTADKERNMFAMSKNLHLSQLHSPYNNLLDEHFCRRWIASQSIQDIFNEEEAEIIANAQISEFWNSDNSYLCISLAIKNEDNPSLAKSVTIGLLINDKLKSIFHFLGDSNIKRRVVSTTCERCDIKDCEERASEPVFIWQEEEQKHTLEELEKYL
jgi:transcriptional regulator with XRE-family HTH domain